MLHQRNTTVDGDLVKHQAGGSTSPADSFILEKKWVDFFLEFSDDDGFVQDIFPVFFQ